MVHQSSQGDDAKLAERWADWLVDAVAGATQDRRYLRGDEAEDRVATEAILVNGRKAISSALKISLRHPHQPQGGVPSKAQIAKAVDAVLAEDRWPVCRDHDDAGLERYVYVEFVSEVLAALPSPQAAGVASEEEIDEKKIREIADWLGMTFLNRTVDDLPDQAPALSAEWRKSDLLRKAEYVLGKAAALTPSQSKLDAALLSSDIDPWANLPKHYVGRWSYDYDENRSTFFVCCNGHRILDAEDTEVCEAICKVYNSRHKAVVPTISQLDAGNLAAGLMIARNVPEQAQGDSDVIAEAIKEAQSILDALPPLYWRQEGQNCVATAYGKPWCNGRCQNPRDCTARPLEMNLLDKLVAAYGEQRDDINDADLDREQPISLTVCLTIGDIRDARSELRRRNSK